MSSGGTIDTVGDNKEFTLTTAGQDVTVYFISTSNTSANDTATEKYFDTSGVVKQFALRTDQALHIISMTGVTMTDPISVLVNTAGKTTGIHTEKFDTPVLTKMVLRATVSGTNVKIRTRGR